MPKTKPKKSSKKKSGRLVKKLGKFNVFHVALFVGVLAIAGITYKLSTEAAATYELSRSGQGIGALNAKYAASRTTLPQVLAGGTNITAPGPECRKGWNGEAKSAHIDWSKSSYFCWGASQYGKDWTPQGIGGSATTTNFNIGSQPARDRNLLLVSWYSKSAEADLVAPGGAGDDVNRISFIDLDRQVYRNVELVKACDGSGKMCKLNSHAGGVAWAGKYIYLATSSSVYVFNLDHLYNIGGKYVLAASDRWSVTSATDDNIQFISSLSIDRSASPDKLISTGYKKTGDSRVFRWNLGSDNLLSGARTVNGKPTVKNSSQVRVPRNHLQGAASWKGVTLVNSSSEKVGSASGVDAMFMFKNVNNIEGRRMPGLDVQSIYIDDLRNKVWTLTEHHPKNYKGPSQIKLVFNYPLSSALRD